MAQLSDYHLSSTTLSNCGDIGVSAPSLRRTKIVCTLGPACIDPKILTGMIRAGCNVMRLNFSFGDHDQMRSLVRTIRSLSKELNTPVGILGDLQGPKYRTGELEDGQVELVNGAPIKLAYAPKTAGKKGNKDLFFCPHKDLISSLIANDRILIYDGLMEIQVTERIDDDTVQCKVTRGGTLLPRKGLNVPTNTIKVTDLLPKDKEDALLMLECEVDYIGMSFVQTADDVTRLRSFLIENKKQGQPLPLICSKIEKPSALEHLDSIMEVTDAVMVARGDLGVECSLEMVPMAQKQIIRKANEKRKPVITATQMLQSMTTDAMPTRAEVSDVANAVFDGTDAVMTSQETSMGVDPVHTVATMAKVVATAEAHLRQLGVPTSVQRAGASLRRWAVASSAFDMAHKADARAIVCVSISGRMAVTVSKGRPHMPVIAVTPDLRVAQSLTLNYAVWPLVVQLGKYTDPTLALIEEAMFDRKLVVSGELLVWCAGTVSHLPGLADSVKLAVAGDSLRAYTSAWKHVFKKGGAAPVPEHH